MPKNLTKPFLLLLVLLVLIGCYLVFRPFLTEIFVAAIMASVFYTPYQRFSKFLRGHNNLAAVLMCLLLLILIILPTVKLMTYAGEKSVDAYSATVAFFDDHTVNDLFKTSFFQQGILSYLHLENYRLPDDAFKNTLLSVLKQSSNWLISGATFALKETTTFVISIILIVVAMFFFFIDGQKMLERLMRLSPLPNKYDIELFNKFRAVSYSTLMSTFVSAIGQGIVGAIGFAIVGFPALLAGVLIALLSLLPIGSVIFYLPMGLYYLLIGSFWQGIFILLWGMILISSTDNIIRTYMIKGRAEINPLFVLFSILGGVVMFGFWGVVLGPLIIALAVTVLHLYELEFCDESDSVAIDKIASQDNKS